MIPVNRRHLFSLSAGAALAATPLAALATPRQGDLREDVAILGHAWRTMHPGLYRYNTPDQIDAVLSTLEQQWSGAQTFPERMLALTRATAAVRCGHTYPSPFNSSDATVALMYPGRTLVPFRFRWLAGRMVVTDDYSAERAFARGASLIAINGVPAADILSRLRPLARADGGNDAKRVSLMEVRGDDRFEAFDIHLPLILPGLADRAEFTLEDGRRVEAALLTLAERQATAPANASDGSANPWTVERRADGIAVLTMPTWALYRSTFDWRTWLGELMDELTTGGAPGLIVDLRGNEGGQDCGEVLLSHLIERDLPLANDQRWTRYRRAPDSLRPHLQTWDRSFLDWGDAAAGPDEHGFYRLNRPDDAEGSVLRPASQRYRGRVTVLCDASNSSATFQFARTVKDNGLATLLGETTGGNRRGINGGAFFFLQLPASGFVVDLPLIASFPATPQPDAGIEPDIRVETTAGDIADRRDPQLAAAVAGILRG